VRKYDGCIDQQFRLWTPSPYSSAATRNVWNRRREVLFCMQYKVVAKHKIYQGTQRQLAPAELSAMLDQEQMKNILLFT
jgi:hypothetical protein